MFECLLCYTLGRGWGLLLILFLQSMTATYGFLYGFLTKRELKGIEKDRDDEVSTEADRVTHFSCLTEE
jgi:hypothetical protein